MQQHRPTKVGRRCRDAWFYQPSHEVGIIQCNLDQARGELVSRTPIPANPTAFLIYGLRTVGGGRNNHAASEVMVIKK